jgi:N-acetylglutamate synthase-like GNAT family acetyltransferase
MEITKNYKAEELQEFKRMALGEWQNVDFSKENEAGLITPKPILARENGLIIGGLSYVWYPNPDQSKLALWVNTVVVLPSCRNHGVGTELIRSAMQEQAPETELFVYTARPNLYLKLGWSFVSADKEHHVLKYVNKSLRD